MKSNDIILGTSGTGKSFSIKREMLDVYTKEMNEKYGDSSLETDDFKFIWGVKSWNDLSGNEANLHTLNDIDIVYDKEDKKYMLGVETAYCFKTHADECMYLRNCLDLFTKYMDDNNLKRNTPYMLFMSQPCTSMTAKTIEELYVNFKIFVDGFCNLNEYTEEKREY